MTATTAHFPADLRFISPRAIVSGIAVCLISASAALAQTGDADQRLPVASVIVQDVRQSRIVEFLDQPLIDIDASKVAGISSLSSYIQPFRSQRDDSEFGILWYFLSKRKPAFGMVRFQEVQGETEARRMLLHRKANLGSSAGLRSFEGRYLLTDAGQSVFSVPPGVAAGELAAVASLNRPPDPPGYRVVTDVIDRNGELLVQSSWQTSELYRYQDGIIFDAPFEEFENLNLPSISSLTGQSDPQAALSAELYVDRIPESVRQQAFNVTNALMGTYMQRRSNERAGIAGIRKSVASIGVSAARAALLDIEHVSASIRFSGGEIPRYHSTLDVQARDESQLADQLRIPHSSHSAFAPIINDDAALTMQACFRLPSNTRQVFPAVANWLQVEPSDKSPFRSSLVTGVVCDVLSDFSEQDHVDVFLKTGWTESTQGVIYAGVRIPEHGNLLNAIAQLISDNDPGLRQRPAVSMFREGELEFLSIGLPQPLTRQLRHSCSLTITHIFIAQEGSRLWMSAGSDAAIDIIRQCIQTCRDSPKNTAAPLASFDLDVRQWRSYPQNDGVGVAGLLERIDSIRYQFPPTPPGVRFQRRSVPRPSIDTVLLADDEQRCQATVHATGSGIQIECRVAESIAHYCVARYLDYRMRWTLDALNGG